MTPVQIKSFSAATPGPSTDTKRKNDFDDNENHGHTPVQDADGQVEHKFSTRTSDFQGDKASGANSDLQQLTL
eukprot:4501874-Karenia_brevis.AAC.1